MNAASAGPNLATTLNNLNPLRPTGPKTGATRGKPAAPIVLSDLPKVSRSDFVPYVDSIKEEYATWSKLQSAINDTPILDDLHEVTDGLDEEQVRRRQAVKDALDSSNLEPSVRSKRELPSLESIPHIFFEESFSLANPNTFDDVTRGTIARNPPGDNATQVDEPTRSLATGEGVDQILQERLTHYLDIVEVHLSVEIRVRSASFFSALANLQALDTQSAEALRQIALLKSMLQEVDQAVARRGLDRIRQCKRRQRLKDLDSAIERVKAITRALEHAEYLGEAGETQEALDLAEELQLEWHSSEREIPSVIASRKGELKHSSDGLASIGEDEEEDQSPPSASSARRFRRSRKTGQRPPLRISQIAALHDLPGRLAKLRHSLGQSLESELVAVVTHDARENLAAYVAARGHWRAAQNGEVVLHEQAAKLLGARLSSILAGLTRCGSEAVESAITAWRSVMLAEMRRNLQEQLPSAAHLLATDDDHTGDISPSSRSSLDIERPASVLSGVRAMSPDTYLETSQHLHLLMLGCLSIADTQAHTILSLVRTALESHPDLSASKGLPGQMPEARSSALQNELQDGIQALADLANVRLARVVSSRAEIHSSLALADFVAVFNESWHFVLSCEVICKKMVIGLRSVLVAQSKSWLQAFHQRHVSEAATLVEKEQWSPADVPVRVQQIVNRFVESAVNDPEEWSLGNSAGPVVASPEDKAAKHLEIEEKTYFAVGAGLRLIEFLEEYLQVVVNLPLLTTDTMARIIELLKVG